MFALMQVKDSAEVPVAGINSVTKWCSLHIERKKETATYFDSVSAIPFKTPLSLSISDPESNCGRHTTS